MSTIETQHGAYLESEPLAGEYAVETTPLLRPNSDPSSSRARSHSRETGDAQNSQEHLPTLPLLLDQFIILLKSSLPVFGTHLLEYALLITSVLAVGHLGKLELAACTLGSMTANVTSFSIVIGMGGALDTVLPGVWGASAGASHDSEPLKIESGRDNTKLADSRLFGLWCQRMGVLYLFLLVPMLCIWLNAEGILVLLRQDKEVARLAGRYLAMLAFGLPAFSFNTIAKRYFQAQGLFSVPTKIGTIVAGVNFVLTGLFVYYPHPLPRTLAPYLHLGFDGAPLATAISYNLVALGSVFWGWRIEVARRLRREAWEARHERVADQGYYTAQMPSEGTGSSSTAVSSRNTSRDVSPAKRSVSTVPELHLAQNHRDLYQNEMRPAWHPLSVRALHPTGLGTLLTLGLGGVGQTASEWWAWELVGLAASLLGPTALAAQSVLLVSCSTTYQVPFSLGVATSVRIGQLLGLAQPRLAKLAAHAAILLGFALSLIFSVIFWIWRKEWSYLFNNDEDVAEMVASILPLVALFQVFDGNAGITGGVLRARGKQGTGALLNLSAYYVLGVPLGVYLAFKDIGLPESLPDHSVVHSLSRQITTMLAPQSAYPPTPLPSLHFQPLFNGSNAVSPLQNLNLDDPVYPSLPEATAGLRGLWTGLTVSLVYCAVLGTILCLMTDWEHEVDKVRARLRAEERRDHQENARSNSSGETTFTDT
ncbi:mate-domain-containing protein [Lentinula edodes]|uniref:mate-domain-containing protein n=1 Tax=Lentinula edodes TaxID=5353 RepID=UPI001E8D707E|nr:mate-domain-containing protein [Lentinula edodes]KAH7880040.1 mate-domain-containing protein [Lentinula edodes]